MPLSRDLGSSPTQSEEHHAIAQGFLRWSGSSRPPRSAREYRERRPLRAAPSTSSGSRRRTTRRTTVEAIGPLTAVGRDIEQSNTRGRFVFPDGALIDRPSRNEGTYGSTSTWTTCVFSEATSGDLDKTRAATAVKTGTDRLGDLHTPARRRPRRTAGCKRRQATDIVVLVIEAHGPLSL